MSTLETLLLECLPDGALLETVSRGRDGFVFTFFDVAKERRTIDFWDKNGSRQAYRKGSLLAFAYRPRQESANDYAREERVIAALLANEERLFNAMKSFVEKTEPRPLPGRPIFLRETSFALQVLRVLPRTTELSIAVRNVLDQALAMQPDASELHVYFESSCAQACEFCEEPQKRHRLDRRVVNRLLVLQHDVRLDIVSSGSLRALLATATERGLPITITGHDWTKHPHRDELLDILATLGGARFRLQGPSLAFDSRDLARRIATLPGLDWIATTLQSSDPNEHDVMVGAAGAFARLIPAIENLKGLGIRVQLTLVLTRRALRSLANTLGFLHARNWFVELAAFVPDQGMLDAGDKLAPLDELHAALEQALPAARAVVQSLVGVPPCAVPEALRSKIAPVLHTKERARAEFGAACCACTAFSICSGVPNGYGRFLGERGMEPLEA
jgi:hypothetical protein